MEAIIVIIATLAVLHLAGGLHSHRRHRRDGLNPRLYYSLGRGWYGSVRVGGFRVGHRL